MATSALEAIESPKEQGRLEEKPYRFLTTPVGSSPTSVSVKIFDVTDGGFTEITGAALATIMPVATITVAGDYITLSPLKNLTPWKVYRLEIKFTAGGMVHEGFCIINAVQ